VFLVLFSNQVAIGDAMEGGDEIVTSISGDAAVSEDELYEGISKCQKTIVKSIVGTKSVAEDGKTKEIIREYCGCWYLAIRAEGVTHADFLDMRMGEARKSTMRHFKHCMKYAEQQLTLRGAQK